MNALSIDSAWQPVKIGAGGWLVGIDVAPDGTLVVRTDTYGAYLWDGAAWNQLATASSMPTNVFYSAAVYELRIAPSDSNIFYMQMSDGLYKTVDKGATWVKTAFPVTSGYTSVANRMDGQKMAIDPTNPDIVFAGTQSEGLWVTRDGGTSWQKIAAVPQGSNTNDPGLTGIVIQGSTVFVGTAGSGVYMSIDKGVTWKAIGGPADVSHAAMSADGSYYATDNSVGALWKFADGTWKVLIDSIVHAVAVDPFDPNHIVVTNHGGGLRESKDGGATWGEWNHTPQLESSNDIPWLETGGLYMASGGLVFDPLVQGQMWQSGGVGVWQTQLPTHMAWNTPVIWNSRSMGIEQLVANEVIAPAGGNPIFASWDRPFFEMGDLDSYATSYGGGQFSMGWSVDYASSSPNFIVGISDYWGTEQSGYSTDGGKTWQKFEGLPSWALNTVGGSIAASSPTNFIWAPSGNVAPAYTLDGGKTWTNINIPGKTDWTGFHHYYYLDRTTITADRVQPNTFYLYDTYSGVYRTTDGGVNWTKVFDGQVSEWSYWHAKIEAVPGSPGELYFTSGPQQALEKTGVPGLIPFMHSQDGGASWQAVDGVKVSTFGFGAAKDSGGPASIYIVGSVNGVFGIWYSADNAATWTQIGERPMGSLDEIRTISGDMDQFGLVYVGFGGSGYAYLDFSGSQPTPTPAPVPAPIPVATIASALDYVGTPQTVKSGAIINDATPTFSGTLSSPLAGGQYLALYRDGELLTKLSPTTTSWKFTDPGAPDGTHQYTVRVESGDGQKGSLSSAFSLTVDTIAPDQLVNVTGTSTVLSAKSTTATAQSTLISGEISAALAPGESLIVFRDGVAVGVGTVTNGNWTFSDNVGSGSYAYTARVQDAAGNLGPLSEPYTTSTGTNFIYGTTRSDVLVGTDGADHLSGVPATGTQIGKGSVDVLTGGGGADVFVLGDSRGRFYDDNSSKNSGVRDYARITDFAADDKLQLYGSAEEYFQSWTTLSKISGTGIYHDTNGNGRLDSKDELIALIQNHGPVDLNSMNFVDGSSILAPTTDVPIQPSDADRYYDDGSSRSPRLKADAYNKEYVTNDTLHLHSVTVEYSQDWSQRPYYPDDMTI